MLKYDRNSHFLRNFFFSIKFPQFREFSLQFRETWRSRPISGDSRKFRETWQVWEHQKAFDSVKETIATSATLAYFDSSKPVIIQTDASKRGVGAKLLQDGRPLAYAIKSLTETESNYCNIDREMLGIVFGLERFHHYAYGRHVTIESDHKPIESIKRKQLINTPPRLMRMLLRIQKYDFTVKCVPGKDIPIADGLSCLPIQGDEIPDIDVTIHDITGVSESRLEKNQGRDEMR